MKLFYVCAFFFSFLTILYAAEPAKSGCLEREKALSLLEIAENFLSKAKDYYPSCKKASNSTDESDCSGQKLLVYIEIAKKTISDIKENFPTCKDPIVKVHSDKPRDCSEILANGHNQSGVYAIWPRESFTTGNELQVYCDMETDYGGWTVIQRRGKFAFQRDFYQDWKNYKNGFGNISEEFWLGNENIRILCYKGCEIRFDLQANNGMKGYAVYKHFNLTRSSYTLYITHYEGDVGDCMFKHNNFAYSTKDKGQTAEAQNWHGGWWYSNDNYCMLNGIFQPGKSSWDGIIWSHWRGKESLASVEIKVRPK